MIAKARAMTCGLADDVYSLRGGMAWQSCQPLPRDRQVRVLDQCHDGDRAVYLVDFGADGGLGWIAADALR